MKSLLKSSDEDYEKIVKLLERKLKESTYKLKALDERYRYFIENSIEGLWVIDKDVKTTLVNSSTANILGYTTEEMIGRSLFEFMDEKSAELTKIHLEKRKKGISEERDNIFIHRTGEKVHLRIRATPIFNEEGNYEGSYAFLTDITEQKLAEEKLKESEEKYRVLSEQSQMGIFIIQEGRFKYSNQAVSDIIGYSVEEMLNWVDLDIAKIIYEEDLEKIMNSLKRSLENDLDEFSNSIFRIITKNGKLKWIQEYNKKIIYKGKPASLVTLIDISSKIESEQKLRESEEQFRTLTEQSFLGIAILQNNFVKYVNKQLADIVGYKVKEIMKWGAGGFMNVIHHKDRQIVAEQARKKQTGESDVVEQYQFRGFKKNGDMIWLELFSKTINYRGELADFVMIREITDKKVSEQKLKESEEKYRSLFENMTAGFAYHEVIADDNNKPIDYKYLEVNPAFEKLTGIKKENLIGKTVTEAIPGTENDPADWIGRFGNVGITGVPLTVEEYSEAIKKWFRVSGYSPKKGFFAVTFTDITDIKEAEQKLKESEEQFRTIAEQSFMGIIIIQDGLFKYFNEKAVEINGYTIEEVQNWEPNEFFKLIHPDDRNFVLEQAQKKQSGDPDIIPHYQYRLIKKNGDVRWVENFSKSIIYKGRTADFVMTIDITDKILAEEKIRESEEKFRKITEESLLAICIIQDDVIKYVNREMAHLYGYSVEEMMSWKIGEMLKTVAPGSLEVVKEQLKKKQSGDPDVIIHYPIECIHKNGDSLWVDNLSKTIIYEGRLADLVTQIDITERIKAQKELVKLNQLKSELLRRTSHELKTPLVSIKGFSELLLEVHRDKLDALVISTLNEIKQGCLRLETLINDILKTAELESEIITLSKSEEDLAFLVKVCVNEIKGFSKLRNHKISLKLDDNLITHFEKEQIHQVISNLLNNAVKYTPPGGLIEIKSETQEEFIVLSIKDNGIGFTEEEKNRIFKQFGKIERYGQGLDIVAEGSGFGLYISKKIIELHKGNIWVKSEGRNKGSTFFISLPII